jgi:hypothetical protein
MTLAIGSGCTTEWQLLERPNTDEWSKRETTLAVVIVLRSKILFARSTWIMILVILPPALICCHRNWVLENELFLLFLLFFLLSGGGIRFAHQLHLHCRCHDEVVEMVMCPVKICR